MRFAFKLALPAAALLTLAGCKSADSTVALTESAAVPKGSDAVAYLKHSMDVYEAMPAFKTDGTFSMTTGGMAMPATKRSTSYEKPNRFHVVSSNPAGFTQTSVSDGKSVVEFDNQTGLPPRKEAAPAKISEASSMQMKHPMFCGSLIYQFFGGSGNYAHLVDSTKAPVTFGPDEKSPNGEASKVVKFYGPDQYGHVEVLIGQKTGYVYRIRYDSEPLVKQIQDPGFAKTMKESLNSVPDSKVREGAKSALAVTPKLTGFNSEETFDHPETLPSLPATTFDATPPTGTKAVEEPAMPSFDPPVPLGSPAPDFSVTSLNGKTFSLTKLRGHPILLDFWATWCGPCVASLPHTQDIFTQGGKQGLTVLAISDEDKATVSKFIREKNYTFTTCLDSTKAAGTAYKTNAIPTTVVIDSNGKLVAYIVGGGQDKEIGEALKKVGVDLQDHP